MDGLTHLLKIKSHIRRHQLRNGAVGEGGTPSPCYLIIECDRKPVSTFLASNSARLAPATTTTHSAGGYASTSPARRCLCGFPTLTAISETCR